MEIGIIGFFLAIKVLLILSLINPSHEKRGRNYVIKKILGFIIFALVFALCIFYWFYEFGGSMFRFLKLDFSDLYKVRFAVALLFFSHGFSFFVNFIKNKEYKKGSGTKTVLSLMDKQVDLFSRFLIFAWASVLAIAVYYPLLLFSNISETSISFITAISLVLVKGYFDLKTHIKEHTKNIKKENNEKLLEKNLDSEQLLAELRKPSSRK